MPALTERIPIIRPITDLRTHLNDVFAQASETQEPVILTKNGTATHVLMDCEAYNAMEQRNRMYLALREAEIEQRYRPEALTQQQSDERMREIFNLWGLSYA